ncbi:MAG: hypothetical protein ACYTAF_03180 [Planctomycetota bacterium]|jgi:hypothetical protein
MRRTILLSAALAALLVTACDKKDENIFLTTTPATTAPTDSAHHKGESCDACHDWNIVQLHDAGSPEYNDDCMTCHGDMTDETTLSTSVTGIHPEMCPEVFQAAGTTTYTNAVCIYCHQSVDILGGSAGHLRKQVDVADCRTCHSVAGPGRELYE